MLPVSSTTRREKGSVGPKILNLGSLDSRKLDVQRDSMAVLVSRGKLF